MKNNRAGIKISNMKNVLIINSLPDSLGDYCSNRVADVFRETFGILRIDSLEEPFPDDPAAYIAENQVAALVAPGSIQCPLDDDKWIRDMEEFLRGAIKTKIPMLGICFGHEAFASAFGGRLAHRGEYTIATRYIKILRDDPIFAGFAGETRQVVAHSYHVVEAPPDFEVIGVTEDCPVQVMKHKELPVYGVQFHPEVDPEIKVHDDDWVALTYEELTSFQGPELLNNFLDMLKRA